MKKPLLIIFLATILFSSCIKNDKGCTPQDASIEKPAMVAFCTSYGITYTEHNSGILYQITNPGTGIAPTVSSKIYITYSGKLLNGTVFDSQSDPAKTGWVLNSLIDGWKIGIPLIKKGGSIKLVIPSYLAYSCNGSGSIAANSPLYF
ncbi:MAG: FKBP-type peptidyl-prolyl cis-trans isomerase, partial [Chitinophagaceae bacterium]|nr:FKBP-type peptidyl-prolyl cis-trans isomerase [Chitinophagaceae bacterium]